MKPIAARDFNFFRRLAFACCLLVVAWLGAGCRTASGPAGNQFSSFIGVDDFATINEAQHDGGDVVWLSPELDSDILWNQLVISWNADAPVGTFLKVEAAGMAGDKVTKFYTLGEWSPDGRIFPRTSVRGQGDVNGTVDTDTLKLNGLADGVQVRVTIGGTNGAMPMLKFLGMDFCNTQVAAPRHLANRAAWGKTTDTPERSQHGYPNEKGWCSAASLSMVLADWARRLNRPELDVPVPEVATAVYDKDFAGTGNWPFNTAFAGSFRGMRSYVTRLDGLREVEDWIAQGIPVIMSVRWDELEPGRPPDPDGHLVVCVGFTQNGDVVVNDPGAHLDRGEMVRRIYKRENVARAWAKSHNTVYLVYQETLEIPRDRFDHW